MDITLKKPQIPFYIGIGFLLSAIVIEFLSILKLNNGLFVYTLDDPYIHMALAKNIMNGHYGINASEFSAPSSSILWPLLIAPFSDNEYFPFLLNVASAAATVFFFIKILFASFNVDKEQKTLFFISTTGISLLLATNIIGLPFNGMEHSLQVLVVSIIAYGLIIEIEEERIALWLYIAIVVAPLIRYECLAISIPALIYLLKRQYFKKSLIALILLMSLVGGFSAFLMTLGLEPFPTSVILKSGVVHGGGILNCLIESIKSALLFQRQAIYMFLGLIAIVASLFFLKDKKRRQLGAVTILAIFLHLAAGRFGVYHRYEIYIWSFMLLVIIYLFAPMLENLMVRRSDSITLSAVVAIVLFVMGMPYIISLYTLPIAANNIYEQQYQMHRFAVDYYNKPIAVNDLGYVSYKNDNYVLDLWGLGSEKSFRYRMFSHGGDWMSSLSNEYDIGLVMIYRDWFGRLPGEWIKIGELRFGRRRITPAYSEVDFYATRQDDLYLIIEKLKLFISTLPVDVKFYFENGLK